MKKLIFLFATLSCIVCYGSDNIQCKGTTATQAGIGLLAQESEFNFQLDQSNAQIPKIANFIGYFNIKAPDTDGDEITSNNGYRSIFSITNLEVSQNYNPRKYFGWFQFKNVTATFTDSIESGMSGNLILELNHQNSFEGKYLFQAGSHIGGTLNLNCHKN